RRRIGRGLARYRRCRGPPRARTGPASGRGVSHFPSGLAPGQFGPQRWTGTDRAGRRNPARIAREAGPGPGESRRPARSFLDPSRFATALLSAAFRIHRAFERGYFSVSGLVSTPALAFRRNSEYGGHIGRTSWRRTEHDIAVYRHCSGFPRSSVRTHGRTKTL